MEPGATRAGLLDAMAIYRAQSSNAVPNFLNNLGWGATTARNAAMGLDRVIAAAAAEERQAEASVLAAQRRAASLNRRQKLLMLVVFGIGSPPMVGGSLLLARRVAGPILELTNVMSRLAERRFEHADIPATGRRDEVGSMARAVEVFKAGMIRAEELDRQQHATQNFLDSVLEHVPVPITVKRAADMTYVHVNRAAEVFLGLPRNEVLGQSIWKASQGHRAPSLALPDTEALQLQGQVVEKDVLIETAGNNERLATVTRLAIPDGDGRPQYLLTMIEDITERRAAEQRVAYMAHYDSLTDLPNRTLFAARLAAAMAEAQAHGTPVAVLGLDFDHFKEVNDTQGHAAGDHLLRVVGQRLQSCMRDGDTLARLGGDEFAVVQRHVLGVEDAEALAQRFVQVVDQPFEIDGHQTYIGVSIGIALGSPGIAAEELVKQADMALYDAKERGRGGYRCFAEEMDAKMAERRAMENDLRAAFANEQLHIFYQPQIDLNSLEVVGCEALMRWNCSGHGAVAPSQFIPLAQSIGLIGPLGRWLLREACRQAMRWPARMHVAVNVSPVQLRLPGFVEAVQDALAATGLAPLRLELEVTEGVLLRDTAKTLATFAALRGIGVRLALDDFGTGYASLAYLLQFRFDKIKIDRSFVSGLGTDPNASAIVRAVIGLCTALDMRIVTEGVEDDEGVATLRALGCGVAQGFRFFKPMSAEAMERLANAVITLETEAA